MTARVHAYFTEPLTVDINSFLFLLAQQGAKSGAEGQQGGMQQILLCTAMAVGIGLIWYFVFIRPKQQEKQERDDMLDSLEKQDEIVTIGGIRGKITDIEEDQVSVRIDDDNNVTVNCERWAIRDNLTKQDDEDDEDHS
jgi:preprotein translocase subunit YajC